MPIVNRGGHALNLKCFHCENSLAVLRAPLSLGMTGRTGATDPVEMGEAWNEGEREPRLNEQNGDQMGDSRESRLGRN